MGTPHLQAKNKARPPATWNEREKTLSQPGYKELYNAAARAPSNLTVAREAGGDPLVVVGDAVHNLATGRRHLHHERRPAAAIVSARVLESEIRGRSLQYAPASGVKCLGVKCGSLQRFCGQGARAVSLIIAAPPAARRARPRSLGFAFPSLGREGDPL